MVRLSDTGAGDGRPQERPPLVNLRLAAGRTLIVRAAEVIHDSPKPGAVRAILRTDRGDYISGVAAILRQTAGIAAYLAGHPGETVEVQVFEDGSRVDDRGYHPIRLADPPGGEPSPSVPSLPAAEATAPVTPPQTREALWERCQPLLAAGYLTRETLTDIVSREKRPYTHWTWERVWRGALLKVPADVAAKYTQE